MDKQELVYQEEIQSAHVLESQSTLTSPNYIPSKKQYPHLGTIKLKGFSSRKIRKLEAEIIHPNQQQQQQNIQQLQEPITPLTPQSANVLRKKSVQIEHFKQNHKLSISLYKKSSITNVSQETKESLSQEEELLLNKFYHYYEILHKIGEGNHATVFKVKEKSTGQIYAAKVFKTDDEEMQQIIFEEYDVLKNLKHSRIVQPKEYIKNQKTGEVVIIEEYFPGKNLFKFITTDNYKFSDEKIKTIIKQLLEVLSFIHQKGIIHRDITLMNVLYSIDLNEIKLIDFGIALTVQQESRDQIFSPTVNAYYAAPELNNYEEVTLKADSWGVGIIFLSLIKNKNISTQKIVLKENNLEQYIKKINIPQKVYEIISKLLVFKPENRLSPQNALLLEYFWSSSNNTNTINSSTVNNTNNSSNNSQNQLYTITINTQIQTMKEQLQ